MIDRVGADDRHDSVGVDVGALRQERLARLRGVLKEADVAAAVFLDPINIRYATDVSNYAGLVSSQPDPLRVRGYGRAGCPF